jgi:NAD(P)-dependent dehydrogenase (short-subunit alcohol dehydrogenase family)
MAGRLQDRVTVITGAGSGIGRAAASRFAQEGALVAAVDLNEAEARETAARIESAGGIALPLRADVSLETDVQAMVAEVLERFGRLNVLVANAGIEGPPRPVTDVSVEEWDRVMAVNARGLFLCAKHCIPPMKALGGGSIVVTASNCSFTAIPDLAAYCASKGAALMLTRALAVDHAPDNIRTNCVCPGSVDTPMKWRLAAEWSDDPRAMMQGLGRLTSPEEVANLMLFLASDEAAAINGAAMLIDYGETARPGPVWPNPSYFAAGQRPDVLR